MHRITKIKISGERFKIYTLKLDRMKGGKETNLMWSEIYGREWWMVKPRGKQRGRKRETGSGRRQENHARAKTGKCIPTDSTLPKKLLTIVPTSRDREGTADKGH